MHQLFFALTTANKLNTNHVNAKSDGTTDLKLSILPSIMNIAHTAKMIGNYSNTGTTLYTEKVVGNIHACLGLKKSSNSTYYYPNTVLKKDIRNITNKPQCRIIAIFQKNRKDNKYNQICYLLKDKDIKQTIENTQLNNKISVLSNDQ